MTSDGSDSSVKIKIDRAKELAGVTYDCGSPLFLHWRCRFFRVLYRHFTFVLTLEDTVPSCNQWGTHSCEYISIQVNIFSKKERQHECRLSSYCSKIFVLVHFQFLSLLVNIVHFSVHLLEKFFGYNFMARIHRCITRSLISSVRPTFHHWLPM